MPEKCKQRERIASSGNPDIPDLPVGAIRGHLCFRCFSPATNILKCGGCKRAYYCSKACQKLDWSVMHKNHCKIFKTINEVEEQKYERSRTWKEYSNYLLNTVRVIRDAAPRDEALRYIVQAQAYCATCRRTAVQLANRNIALKRCQSCRLVFTCSECPELIKDHSEVCKRYQAFSAIEMFRTEFFEDTGKASPLTCTQFPRETRKLLADSPGWHDYYVNISDKQQIAGVISPDFQSLLLDTAASEEEGERMRMFLLCATDNLTMPLTVVSALEDVKIENPHLNIHLVGATGRELVAMGNFEEILHLMPGVKSLHITAIGPSLMAGQNSPLIPKTSVDCCPGCKRDGRKRSIGIYKGLYHDYAQMKEFEKPDMVVLFNSGWADGDDSMTSWAPTIKYLVAGDVPALFTTYNALEADHEQTTMKAFGANFLVEVAENKWRGLMPTPEFIDEEYGMWYNNAWRYVIGKK